MVIFKYFPNITKLVAMQYAEIETVQRKAKIVLEPEGWGKSYQELHDQTDVSGYEEYLLASTNSFNNPFQQAMEGTFKQRGWFGIILRDVVRNGGKGTDDRGRLNLNYVSHAGTEWKKENNVWVPKNGWYVPNDDCEKINGIVIPFQPRTIIPFETVQTKAEANARFEKFNLNPAYVSYFYRLDNYGNNERFAGRVFDPAIGDGRFGANFLRLSSRSSHDRVASFPAYRQQEPVMKIKAVPEKVAA